MKNVTAQIPPPQNALPESRPHVRLACAACVGHFADVEFRLLPEADSDVVIEHLSSCPDCRIFNEQLDTTRELIAGMPPIDLNVELGDILEHAQHGLADGRIEDSLAGLYRVASVLDVENADELVQETLIDAIAKGAPLKSPDLVDALIRIFNGTRSEPTERLEDAADTRPSAYDSDSETAELFYPDFYEDGPDVGRFVDSPNGWGTSSPLGPADEVATIELFDVVDAAINELPDIERQLISLVDIENVGFEDAALAVRVSPSRAARALNDARIHVRGAIDNYRARRDGVP